MTYILAYYENPNALKEELNWIEVCDNVRNLDKFENDYGIWSKTFDYSDDFNPNNFEGACSSNNVITSFYKKLDYNYKDKSGDYIRNKNLKEIKTELYQPPNDGAGSGSSAKKKYLKYKNKYLKLKKILQN